MVAMTVEDARRGLEAMARVLEAHRDTLTELDGAIGDGDHGINMARGFHRAAEKLREIPYAAPGTLFRDLAMALMASVGGASGPLYGTFFLKMSAKLTAPSIDAGAFAEALEEGLRGVQTLGQALPGDKTMVDALSPAVQAFRRATTAGDPLCSALEKAVEAARRGMEATVPLVARRGRASYLGERSAGHQDPGATSAWLLLGALRDGLREKA